jgi:hypothetical protein
MKSVTEVQIKEEHSGIDRLKEILLKLVETHSHELPDEAIQSKRLVKDYFFGNDNSK